MYLKNKNNNATSNRLQNDVMKYVSFFKFILCTSL